MSKLYYHEHVEYPDDGTYPTRYLEVREREMRYVGEWLRTQQGVRQRHVLRDPLPRLADYTDIDAMKDLPIAIDRIVDYEQEAQISKWTPTRQWFDSEREEIVTEGYYICYRAQFWTAEPKPPSEVPDEVMEVLKKAAAHDA